MDPSLQPLLARLDGLPAELRDGVEKAIRVAELDPEMALTRSRKVLESVVREVYERRINEPAGTRPLENLLQRLVKEGHLPTRLDAHANAVRLLGNVGTHGFGQAITAADVQQSLSGLLQVLDWYTQEEQAGGDGQRTPDAGRPVTRLAIVPKGLRSFDAKDADFFLGLLPGPRDANGLPESIRFWKHRIEEKDEPTFTVGVIYGPSGCGKSSLVKAGLLPRLAGYVLSVYVEATADDTEVRLLKGLRRRCPGLPDDLDLAGTVAALRHGTGLERDQKVLIVLDQFEQWLHGRRGEENAELSRSLRQCDGEHVQCLVLVRDDFWVALSRFMADLHIQLVQGQNISLVDLFDPLHARSVLSAFGRAFGRLPDEPSKEQAAFLDQAVAGLAQDGRVICVRLALFAEMVKGKPWTPATLKEVGGTEGVGVAFLEETFSSAAAGPRNRLHQQAARGVLRALLPEQGSDIKGNMQSREKLLLASGYARRPKDFEELLGILDGEVRLITPTQPPEQGQESEGQAHAPAERYYQLTHDYLVPSLREWLARKQKETRRGRAELRLAERTALWQVKPENRHLPAWWEWLNICLLTRKRYWTPPQREMMRRAAWFHAVRGTALAVFLAAITVVGLAIRRQVIEHSNADEAAGLVHTLRNADIAQVPGIIQEMQHYDQWVGPPLRQENERAEEGSRQKLYTSLALLDTDRGQVEYLFERLLKAGPAELLLIRSFLREHKHTLVGRLWGVLENPQAEREQRFRAACALADYEVTDDDSNRRRWQGMLPFVADRLLATVEQNPGHYDPLLKTLDPARGRLIAPLSEVFRNDKRPDGDRSWAASFLAEYAADRPDVLAGLLLDADDKQFAILWPKAEAPRQEVVRACEGTLGTPLEKQKTDDEKEHLAKRQANAAVALLRLGHAEAVWPLLKHNPDPRVRSYLIHRLSPLGADPKAIINRLGEEKEASIRRALLLCLGEFTADQFPPAEREPLIGKVLGLYHDDPDAGLHGAAEWLLRAWGQQDKIKEFEQEWAKDGQKQRRNEREDQIRRELAQDTGRGQGSWYVNGQGQTMVVIHGPVEFLMGSPPTEVGREGGPDGPVETQHRKRIGRSFAVASKEVTVEQFLRFRKEYGYSKQFAPTADCPVNDVMWYDAAAYCNWLSKQEGVPDNQWCYEPKDKGEFAAGMQLKPNYLGLTGYRLPSEAEWEYACRAGAVTSRYYGETEELLGKYAWYTKNSLDRWMLPGPEGKEPCRKPNDLGLFDILGNAMEWCQERAALNSPEPGGGPSEDKEDNGDIKDDLVRVLRGGSFANLVVGVRSAYRSWYRPTLRNYVVGFRPARTFR
jgi:formylglycine-generating enzyme required for sulfatase activity